MSLNQLRYKVNKVKADGHCFYRAVYNIVMQSSKARDILGIDHENENEGVGTLRHFVSESIRMQLNEESMNTIDNLCGLIDTASGSDKSNMVEDLNEMYPFIREETCDKISEDRYNAIADMIANTDEKMYASGLEVGELKFILKVAEISLLIVSTNTRISQVVKDKWVVDLLKQLDSSDEELLPTKYVGVLLNRDNYHYEYMSFECSTDTEMKPIITKTYMKKMLTK